MWWNQVICWWHIFLFTNDRNNDATKEKASYLFEKHSRWCVANQLSINSEETNFVLFHAKNKPILFLLPLIELNVPNI